MQKPNSILEPKVRSWQPSALRPVASHRARRAPILLGLAAIVAAIGGLAAWSATAPIASAVVASGRVAVASKRKEIQHLDGGIVKTINVHDGDVVKEGDILCELDDTKAKSRHELARAAYFSAVTAQARLVAERDAIDEIAFPAELLDEGRRSPEIAQGLINHQQMFEGRRRELAGQIKIWLQRIAQLKEEIVGLAAEREASARQADLAGKETAVVEDMFERGFVTRQRVHAIRRESAQLGGAMGRLDAGIAKARKEIGETELSIQQLTLKRRSEVLAELKDIEQRIFDLKEAFIAARAELSRLALLAPVGGFVVNSQLHTIGGVIRPGQTVLEIVPDADALIVEARVRPLDIDDVAKDQSTEVRFSAFKQRTTPFLSGTVVHVAADAVPDLRTGELYYNAIISIPRSELDRLGHRLQPGMPAEVLIKTGNRTPMVYLMQPFIDSMNRALREQ